MATVFLTGGTGYLGQATTRTLLARGHRVVVLARPESRSRATAASEIVVGDALQGDSYAALIPVGATLIHLVGPPNPGPGKGASFERVDLGSVQAMIPAAQRAGIAQVVYVSVAHPAPVMHDYIDARMRAEALLRRSGLPVTVLRPWYVLGPGHRWPYLLQPLYWIGERLPATRETARRLGLITLRQMVDAIVHAAEHAPTSGWRTLDVSAIRALRVSASSASS